MNDLIVTVIDKRINYEDSLCFKNLSESDLEDLISICRKANKEIHISFERAEKCVAI